jgi:hypothetical protein
MPLPNFLIIGAQKSGTTWLAHNLRQHPDVFMTDFEIHYFDKDYNFKKGVEWYKEHFKAAKGEKAIGEKTPDYLWANGRGVEGHLPDVHRNVHGTLPEAKLIVVLRNPVERAIAAVHHIICSGRISPLHSIDELLLGRKRYLVEGHGVIDYGMYYRQIKAYHEYFDPGRILTLIFEEDVVQEPVSGLLKVCSFLGIDPSFDFKDRKMRVNEIRNSFPGLVLGYYLPFMRPLACHMNRLLPALKARPSSLVINELYNIYEEENGKLFDLLGRSPVSWSKDTRS